MHIAIVGAGLSGLATAWYLLNNQFKVTLFDKNGIGSGASGIAAGLLHPFAGAHAKLNRFGREGIAATQKLLTVASQTLNKPVSIHKSILRLALSHEQEEDFKKSAQLYPKEVQWMTSDECQNLYSYLPKSPGIWIPDGILVHSTLYLQGLWQACEQAGALFELKKINHLEELSSFDLIIISAGPDCFEFDELKYLKLSIVKGQVLELAWPPKLPPLPFALNSQAYLIMNEQLNRCIVGATYERGYKDGNPDIETAKQEILPKVWAMLPDLKDAQVTGCFAGLRVVTPNHLPVIKKINSQLWVLTGMGSKGLLYHALFAKKLVDEILSLS